MASIARTEVFYRESDGKPMGETPVHRDVMTDVIAILQDWFAADPMAYVSGNMFLYFVEGNPGRNVSPDVMVVRGIDKARDRRIYKTWEEGGKAPDLVVEVSSASTRREDLRYKFGLYQDVLRVPEYYLFDPLAEYLDPPLQGHRLVEGAYQPIAPEAGRLPSQVLGLHFEADGRELRLFDPVAGQRLLTRKEAYERASAEREQERLAYERAMAEREQERLAYERERAAREREHLAYERERAARREAEAEVERLREQLEALKAGRPPDQE